MAREQMMQRVRWGVVMILLGVVIGAWQAGVMDGLTLENLKLRRSELVSLVSTQPWRAAAIYFVVYVALTAASIPGAAVMTLAAGALFGLVRGTLIVSFASTIGASIAFLLARFVLRDSLRARYGEHLKKLDAGIDRDGAFYLFTLRLVPLFPFFMVNVLSGLTSIRLRTFFCVSQLGMLAGTLAYVFAGTQLSGIDSLHDVVSPGLVGAFVLLGILPLLARWFTRALAARRPYRGFVRPTKFDYNLVVIGAGSAGLVSAYIGSAAKAKVALIERHRMGGDCLNTGCIPSKALLRTARLLAEARDSQRYGVRGMYADFNFADAMRRVQEVIAKVEPHDSVARYTSLGVDVVCGDARIVSPWEVEVDGRRISARSLILATGARPLVPKLTGLDTVPYLTSDTVWNLRSLPKRLVVLGGGPIGCELAQAFARFGSEVTQVEAVTQLLPREDADAAAAVTAQLRSEGVRVATAHRALRVEASEAGGRIICEHDGGEVPFEFDVLLLALGRSANVEGFGLQELGVQLTEWNTIEADAMLRTNFPNIHVCGDATGPFQFTHVAAHQAWYAAVNALLAPFWSFDVDYRVIPWATFTDPEVARVGMSENEATERNIEVEVTRYGLDDLDRAIADSADHGFVKVLTAPGRDRILGATIVGAHAGELLAEFVLAMKHGIGLSKLLGTIHVYPTMAEANRYAAGSWKRAHAPQTVLRIAERFFAWRRGGARALLPYLLGACVLLMSLPAFAAFDHNHSAWTALLKQHVRWNAGGTASTVDYAGFAGDRVELDAYLKSLATVPRREYNRWSWPQRQAFLINAYNAATVQLVLTRYPHLKSIRDIGGLFSSVWKRSFVQLLGQTRNLDNIEHGLLRGAPEYRDPRIHFAVNCASIGCPALRPEAFTAEGLDMQLSDQTQHFLHDRTRNRLSGGTSMVLELSPLFDWYGGDFAPVGGVAVFVARYANALGASARQATAMRHGEVELRFLDYDWRLNQAGGHSQ